MDAKREALLEQLDAIIAMVRNFSDEQKTLKDTTIDLLKEVERNI